MKLKTDEVGGINILLIPLIVACLFFFAAFGFGVWAYMGMTDYRDNVDQKVQTAVNVAVEQKSTEKDNEFLEKEKVPTRNYKSSAILGSISFDYPKTWSGYYVETDKDLKLSMQKGLVNGDQKSVYPLKVEVLNSTYDTALTFYEGSIKTGKLKATPFRLAKLPDILGTRFDGEYEPGKNGSVIILPQREKTVKISNEIADGLGDFNNIILPSFTFIP